VAQCILQICKVVLTEQMESQDITVALGNARMAANSNNEFIAWAINAQAFSCSSTKVKITFV
jgi:hypothetical protein